MICFQPILFLSGLKWNGKYSSEHQYNPLKNVYDGYVNYRCQVVRATNFCTVLPNICVLSIWNLFHVTHLAPKILRWFLLDVWKISVPCCKKYKLLFFLNTTVSITPQVIQHVTTEAGKSQKMKISIHNSI